MENERFKKDLLKRLESIEKKVDRWDYLLNCISTGPTEHTATREDDNRYLEAVAVAKELGKISAPILQREIRVGFTRACRLIEALKYEGVISKKQDDNYEYDSLIN